jgi:iron-sulfur cluster repair protein YtfE (RIC family)
MTLWAEIEDAGLIAGIITAFGMAAAGVISAVFSGKGKVKAEQARKIAERAAAREKAAKEQAEQRQQEAEERQRQAEERRKEIDFILDKHREFIEEVKRERAEDRSRIAAMQADSLKCQVEVAGLREQVAALQARVKEIDGEGKPT